MNRHIIHEGIEYVRVSDILQPFTNFGHIDPVVLANKAELGTKVHEIIADDIAGKFSYVEEKCLGYISSFNKWQYTLAIKFLRSEERFFCSDRRITGQIDCVVEMGNKKMLVDFKTSVSESPTWIMQAHLYHYLCKVNGIELDNTMLFVKLDKLGRDPQVFQYKYDKKIEQKCTKACLDYWLSKIINSDK